MSPYNPEVAQSCHNLGIGLRIESLWLNRIGRRLRELAQDEINLDQFKARYPGRDKACRPFLWPYGRCNGA